MKKTLLILTMVAILLFATVSTAFADAMVYDMVEAGYYVYVKTPDGGLNMRYGPGTEYDRVTTKRIPDGTRLYIGYVSGTWGYTEYNGNDGWVALSQTTTTAPQTKTNPTKSAGYYVYVKTPDGGLNMRSGPSTDYEKVSAKPIPDFTRLYIESVSGNWGYTNFEGTYGWVALKQTTTTPPSNQAPEKAEPVVEEVLEEEIEETEAVTEAVKMETAAPTVNEDAAAVNDAMLKQVLLIAVLVLLVIVIALLLIIVINLKNKKVF